MRYGVLGPLVVRGVDGEVVGVSGARVRALLVCLLVAPGRVVGEERLVDELWGEDAPPEHPRNALQGQVSRLRAVLERAFGPGGRGLVVREAAGYRLRVAEGEVDSEVFRDLVRRARDEGDAGARERLLADALGLWRGDAFAGYAELAHVLAAARRLEEERLGAVEERLAIRDGRGEGAGLVGEVEALVAAYPLREKLRVLQLRALYRAGRQTEALAAYEEFRRRLDEELGLLPGPELVRAQRAVLSHEPGKERDAVPAVVGALPAPVARLVGRDALVAEVTGLLAQSRLVTLTGPGGVGKTRLAVEVGHAVRGDFPGGARLVGLAGVRPGGGPGGGAGGGDDAVAGALTAALGLRESSVAGIARALGDRRVLLVLDNCEHLVEPVADVVAALLPAAPGLTVLATSQEALGIPGETARPVEPLPGADAVRLFLARAALPPGYGDDPADLAAVTALCRRLDGIPLALELAAARARTLGVHGLLARLDDRFTVLSGGGLRGLPARQRTLRAVVDWSWDLLTDAERRVLRRLSVQAEGLSPEAAEAVCAAADLRREDVPDLLGRLVERSLVVLADRSEGPVYRLLESVKQYARERLYAAGADESADVRHRHLVHHTDLALRTAPLLHGAGQPRALARLDAAGAEIRFALEHALEDAPDDASEGGDAGRALRAVDALAWYWILRGRPVEARTLLDRAIALPGGTRAERARAVVWRTGVALLEGDVGGGAERIRAALAPYTTGEADDPRGHARALWFLGAAQLGAGDTGTGEELLDRAVAAHTALGADDDARWGTAAALAVRARHALARGDLGAARADGERAAGIFTELGDPWGRLQTVFPLATLHEIAGEYERAAALHRDGLALAERFGLGVEAAKRRTGLGRLALLTGDHTAARDHHEHALRIAREQNFRDGESDARLGLALGARRTGEFAAAETHLRALLTWFDDAAYGPGRALVLAELGFVAEERGDAGTAYTCHRDGLAVARELGDPRALALALEGLAGAHTLAGDPERAAVLLGAAASARDSVGAPLPAAERRDVERVSAAARAALGGSAYDGAYGRGAALEPDAAADYAAVRPPPGPLPGPPLPPGP
ncbi:BTAD domain-containing putative transcriptional regulator [Streptomyces sp. NPDC058953]|uniref:BTAD domain-containing putative transcriptional regulator n=1 Tax=unclassified Streptomyces TaxID=2593676 RepID=UPI0036820CE8